MVPSERLLCFAFSVWVLGKQNEHCISELTFPVIQVSVFWALAKELEKKKEKSYVSDFGSLVRECCVSESETERGPECLCRTAKQFNT